jgi:hypothetical protein
MLVNLIRAQMQEREFSLPLVTSHVYFHKTQDTHVKSLRQFTFCTRILIPVELL